MNNEPGPSCNDCSGCTSRHTDEHATEEIKGAPYILFAAAAIVLASLAAKWLF